MRAAIIAAGHSVGDTVVENAEIAARLDVAPEWILNATGIQRRHYASPGQAASDLAAEAGKKALANADISAEDLDLIIVATSTPDELGPPTACRVQYLLGVDQAEAYDVSAACTGFLVGVSIARDRVVSRTAKHVLVVVGVEVYSRFINFRDRTTSVIFADGAGAAVIAPSEAGMGIGPVLTRSLGQHADCVLIPAGGSRLGADSDTVGEGLHMIRMDGPTLRSQFGPLFIEAAHSIFRAANIDAEDIDLFIPHQPNPRTLTMILPQLGIEPERTVFIGENMGNIGAASIPTGISLSWGANHIKPGYRVLSVSIGAGLSWGAALFDVR
ncbi:3-oxoacyl-ACP synthase III family protein [Natronoglycomyces albus]|uniref:Ketoacyl-ACP synthase III n=1 Tax=Natronoglycomyces albus TaxID=2811108 RepID=A0A895XVE7_9ACTN|nr:ketoacyl-ACP synthase III [Natronoglycomyces albus]QSB06496.1 ketoacyl-ACP synthase III [Natronoglycomyces albus]